MKTVRAALIAALATTIVLSSAGAANAAIGDEVHYHGGMASDTEVTDSSSNGQHGTVTAINGATVVSTVEAGNHFLRFSGDTCLAAPCPQAVIQPPDPTHFTPDADAFAYGADLRLLHEASEDAGMNVFQRGLAVKGESQWKLQVDYGHTSCRWSDGTNTILLPSNLHDPQFKLAVGDWYSVHCLRLPYGVFAIVLSKRGSLTPVAVAYSADVPMGPITPTGQVFIGAKRINPKQTDVQTDQFHGDLDEVYYHQF